MYQKIAENHRKTITQFIGYIFVGGIAFLFDFCILYLLTSKVGISYLISAAIAFIVGLNVNYFLAKYTVFKFSKVSSLRKEYLFVAVVSFSGLVLNQLFMWSLTEVVGFYYLDSKIISAAMILIYNFALRKIFIFN